MFRTLFAFAALMSVISGQAFGDDLVAFNYQGRVKVSGQAYNGTGGFKFAILNTSATAVLWTNDGTGFTGGEPTGSVSLTVSDGVFNVMVGDPAAGMQPINSAIFNSRTPLKLRTWFSDGTHGFEQLNPDNNLVNMTFVTLSTSDQSFTIYVNGATGNDANNGLTTSTAKRTIQAAIDTLPGRLRCDVTVKVFPGTYRELLKIYGITIVPGKQLTLLGDETWTSASLVDPTVRLSNLQDSYTTGSSEIGVYATLCAGLTIKGLLINHFNAGTQLENGTYSIVNCKATENCVGFWVAGNSNSSITECVATLNDLHGYTVGPTAASVITNCSGHHNLSSGFVANSTGSAQFKGHGYFCYNGTGMVIMHLSKAVFTNTYTGIVTNNNAYGIYLNFMSYMENETRNTFSNNPSGNIGTSFGSIRTY